jgi:cobalt-zinc-cadmium resistance protein CzcA
VLERRFKAVPGVIDVTGWGGKTKTYDVTIDLKNKLIAYGLTLPQVLTVLNNSNVNVGGQTVNFGPQAAIVRGVGLIHSMDDIRNTMLTSTNGTPVLLSDVATVEVGHLPRLGIAGQDDDDDIVQGIVLMHRGEKRACRPSRASRPRSRRSTARHPAARRRVEKIYDRTDLIASPPTPCCTT